MYQDRSAANNANNSEDYLLGKVIKEVKSNDDEKDGKKWEKKKIIPVIKETLATPENEAFVKMMEDPLVYIKMKEMDSRNLVYDNPLKMK